METVRRLRLVIYLKKVKILYLIKNLNEYRKHYMLDNLIIYFIIVYILINII